MDFRKMFICASVMACACVSFCGEHLDVERNTDDSDKKPVEQAVDADNKKFFEEMFLVSSQLNVVYENAIGFLHGVFSFDELMHSEQEMIALVSNNEHFDTANINEFFEILGKITDDFMKNASEQEIDTAIESLSDSYKNVVNELNSYID